EWEYCCRAGTTTTCSFGDTIDEKQAQFSQRTVEVGSFPANAWGLHDMHGNVWEWCEDNWHENYGGNPPTDGAVWRGGDASLRVLRGGSWDIGPRLLRSADRFRVLPAFREICSGFLVPKPFYPPPFFSLSFLSTTACPRLRPKSSPPKAGRNFFGRIEQKSAYAHPMTDIARRTGPALEAHQRFIF